MTKILELTREHATAYLALRADLDAQIGRRLAARRELRPARQRAARRGVETKRRAG